MGIPLYCSGPGQYLSVSVCIQKEDGHWDSVENIELSVTAVTHVYVRTFYTVTSGRLFLMTIGQV